MMKKLTAGSRSFVAACVLMGNLAMAASSSAAALLPRVEKCPSDLKQRLGEAKRFLIEYQKTLAGDFEIEGRRGQERRSERQIMRRVEKLNFVCKNDKNCSSHTALQGTVVGGNRVRICSNELKEASFCKVVEIAAHEFGHNAHIPKDRYGAHNRRGPSDPDQVYQFGFYARELCRVAYGTGFLVGGRSSPRRNPGLVGPRDIVLHPKKNFKGYPFHLSISIIKGERRIDRVRERHARMDDLRFIGLNDSISSIRINRGRWKVCSDKDYRGKCVTLTHSVANLKNLKMNNKISSIRYLGD